MKVVQVCPESQCDNKPTEPVKVGNQQHIFCCQKGFEQSLRYFANTIDGPEEPVKGPNFLLTDASELCEEAKDLVTKLFPPETYDENSDVERLYEIISHLHDIVAVATK